MKAAVRDAGRHPTVGLRRRRFTGACIATRGSRWTEPGDGAAQPVVVLSEVAGHKKSSEKEHRADA